jgi:Holliday junction resolvase RusA-like endonuclease
VRITAALTDGHLRIDHSDESAGMYLTREVAHVNTVARFTIHGEPASKSRPRFSRRNGKVHAYTPEQTKAAERAMGWAFKGVAPGHQIDEFASYGVMAVFFHGTNQRRDVDNMIKLICDGLNGIAWADDSQVVEVAGRRGYGPREHARTEVLIYEVGRVDRDTALCARCGKEFLTYPSTKAIQRYCSGKCMKAARIESRTRDCEQCGERFDGVKQGYRARFCSVECRTEYGRTDVTCTECGASFRMAASTARQRKNHYCSPDCKAAATKHRETYCVNGHRWDEHGSTRASGRRYCKACSRKGGAS